MQIQLNEIGGKYQFDKRANHAWHSAQYKDLLDKVVPLRREYRFVPDADGRKEMAKAELGHWTEYLGQRKNEIKGISAVRDQMAEDIDQLAKVEDS